MEKQVDLSQLTKSQQVTKEILYDPSDLLRLESQIDATIGPLNWPLIRNSWIISELIPGFTRILVFEEGMVKEFRGGVMFCEAADIGCDIQIEVIDLCGDLTCVDVIMSDGQLVTHLNLAQRLSQLPADFEDLTGISVQNYYKYDQETINVIKQHVLTDYVIQNSCDPYERQVRRYVRVKVNEHSVIEGGVLDSPIEVHNMDCTVKDVEEQIVISGLTTANFVREECVRQITIYGKLCFVTFDLQKNVSNWGIPMYDQSNDKFKIIFYSLQQIFVRIGIGTMPIDFRRDVRHRVKMRRIEYKV